MSIVNIEQKRAGKAVAFWRKHHSDFDKDEGNMVRGLPALLINNGLLATGAFAVDKGKNHLKLFREIANFLCAPEGAGVLSILDFESNSDDKAAVETFIEKLSKQNSDVLRRATTEALAYAGYLKRFAPAKERNES